MVEGNVQNSSGKSGQLRQSIAGTRQEIIAPVVWIGSQQINVAQLMLDTVALVQQLAEQLASHTPPDTGQPTNSSAIAQSGQQEILTRHRPVSLHNPLPQRVFIARHQTASDARTGATIAPHNHQEIVRRARDWLRHSPGKIIAPQTKSALHRTRLRVLHQENFSVLFFYKPDRRAAAGFLREFAN